METRDIIPEAIFIIETNATVRQTAKALGIPKSTVHRDMAKTLKNIDFNLYKQVRKILDLNKAERHIRGGMSTKIKKEKERLKEN